VFAVATGALEDADFIARARTDIPALLAHIEELERRTSYTVGETEWANRIANAERRYLDAEAECIALRRELAALMDDH
jgi:hypothetical protein